MGGGGEGDSSSGEDGAPCGLIVRGGNEWWRRIGRDF